MVSAYSVLAIILLRVTPSAKRNSYRVAAAYVCFVMEGIMFVCMDVGVAAAYVVFVMRDMLFVCMDVGCILMPGSTNFNDISGPLWMVRTLGNSVGVAIS